MPEQYYEDALKAGKKEYRSCISTGAYPYLSVLSAFVPETRISQGTDLGVMQIPTKFIVGTRNASRTNTFARNFMPLAEPGSEFALKWRKLCEAHLEEGIREPVKVYEYLNRYYVEEGNKRVSVLKYFDAVNVSAQVIRILPEATAENELYFEFLKFNQCSKINFIEFSKKGSYAALQRLLGKEPDEKWTEEERRRFSSDYTYFQKAYSKKGGKKLNTTVGDAMLIFIQIYGYQKLHSMGSGEMEAAVGKIWEEMALQQDANPIEVKTDPGQLTRQGILSQILTAVPSKLKVSFIYDRSTDSSNWVLGHEQGRCHVQRVFGKTIETECYENVMDGDPVETIEQAIQNGAQVIFTASPRLLPASLRVAVEHPEVILLNCSLNTSHRYIRTYYARMYEAKFIIGAMASAMSQSGRVGYICDYPIYGQIAGINAFALGVQMVNPRAKVYLEWSSVGHLAEATRRLTDQGIQLISSQDMAPYDMDKKHTFGLSRITEERSTLLAAPIWNWGVYYEEILRLILNKSFQKEYESSTKALNYYWGMAAGVVRLECFETVPESVRKMAWQLKEGICAGVIHPFLGEIPLQDGTSVGQPNVPLTVEQVMNMDYLVENVVGRIPCYEELSETGKATVDQVGVPPAQMSPEARKTEREYNADSGSF